MMHEIKGKRIQMCFILLLSGIPKSIPLNLIGEHESPTTTGKNILFLDYYDKGALAKDQKLPW